MKQENTRIAVTETLLELAEKDPDIVLVCSDSLLVLKAKPYVDKYPERFIDVGIAEQNAVCCAAGLASCGLIPFVATYAGFITMRACEQVRTFVAYPGLNVKMVGAYSGILAGKTGITHQSVEDVAIFRAMPHMTILSPSDAVETRAAVRAAVAFQGPVYIRTTRDPLRMVMQPDYEFEIGKALPVREGSDVALVTSGWMLLPTLDAAALLESEGTQALILHVPTIKPFDEQAVEAAARHTGAVVTVEDHSIIGGLGSAVAETLSERFPTLMRRVGMCDCYAESAPNEDLLRKYGLTAENIAATAREVLRLK